MKFKQPTFLSFLLTIIIILLFTGCSINGKYYSKQNLRLHEWIELEKDSTSKISKWGEIRYESEGTWYANGDTIYVQGYEFIHQGRKLISTNDNKVWRKQLIIFPRYSR